MRPLSIATTLGIALTTVLLAANAAAASPRIDSATPLSAAQSTAQSATQSTTQSTFAESTSADGDIGIASNRCGFRTSAIAGSWWIASFAQPYCTACPAVAAEYQKANPSNYYYCTYNPSNDLSDLHGHRR